jgi:hypothetical protein
VEPHIIITRLMDLQVQSTRVLLASRDGLRSEEFKMLQLEIRQLQTQLTNAQRTPTQNTDAD